MKSHSNMFREDDTCTRNNLCKRLEEHDGPCFLVDTEPPRIWTCKIGECSSFELSGSDLPMREAIEAAYHELTGQWPQFLFSGWGGELDESERAVVDEKETTHAT